MLMPVQAPNEKMEIAPLTKLHKTTSIEFVLKNRLKRAKLLTKLKHYTWRSFANTTSVCGILHVVGKTNVTKTNRVLWAVIFTCCLILCLYQCFRSVNTFYQYRLKVKTTYNVGDDNRLKFPAIGFCNKHPFSKYYFGNSDLTRFALSLLTSTDNASNVLHVLDKALETAHESKRFCNYPKDEIESADLDKELINSDDVPDDWQLGYYDSAIACWWQSKEVDCGAMLADLPCPDFTKCFFMKTEMNQVANVVENIDSVTLTKRIPMYTSDDNQLKVNGSGRANGFKILLHVNQDDYCGLNSKWSGAGFKVYVNAQENPNCYPTIRYVLLKPGYHYDIAMSPVITTRKTKDLSLCIDDTYAIYFAKSNVTVYGACLADCLLKLILSKCKCFPPYLLRDKDKLGELLGVELTDDVIPCSVNTLQCVVRVIKYFSVNSLLYLCPSCKVSCYSEKYKLEITALKFPVVNYWRKIDKIFDNREFYSNFSKYDDMRKNALMANFYFVNKDRIDIVEEREMSVRDLFVYYIGNSIFLFLGMSFITPFELVFQLLVCLHKQWLKYLISFAKKPTKPIKAALTNDCKFIRNMLSRHGIILIIPPSSVSRPLVITSLNRSILLSSFSRSKMFRPVIRSVELQTLNIPFYESAVTYQMDNTFFN